MSYDNSPSLFKLCRFTSVKISEKECNEKMNLYSPKKKKNYYKFCVHIYFKKIYIGIRYYKKQDMGYDV
jgi:hypothetical protein